MEKINKKFCSKIPQIPHYVDGKGSFRFPGQSVTRLKEDINILTLL